jgi:hypothetical protein
VKALKSYDEIELGGGKKKRGAGDPKRRIRNMILQY